jgi:hypothetical protein
VARSRQIRPGRRVIRTAVFVAILCCIGLASGVAVAGTNWITAAFQGGPGYADPGGCDPEPERQEETANRPNEPLCGSRFADRLKVSRWGGHHMRGYQGNDIFRAQNGNPDEIRGDSGHDMAYIDPQDVVIGVEACKPIPCSRAASMASLASLRPSKLAGAEFGPGDYHVYLSRTECRIGENGKRLMWFISEPILRAVNATPRVDWQTVAWSPVLYKLDSAQWTKVAEQEWLWDRTNDTSPPDRMHENWWRRFTGQKERAMVWFEPSSPGTYQVRLRYYWYKSGQVPAFFWEDDANSVDPHYSASGFETPTHKSCVFP